MRVINVEVSGQFVRSGSKNAGVQGESGETVLHITFDGTWANHGKRIVWRDARGGTPTALTLTGDTADTPIPSEALKFPGWCSFTVEGTLNGAVGMTAYERLQVAPSLNYNAPLEPTPPQALQLLEQMEGIPNLVVHNLYADNGAIANLVVNRLRTDWEKPFKYLNGDTGDCHYHYIHGITDDWLEADYKGPATEQWKNADGEPIWWKDGVVGGKFTTAESSAPVIVYKYSEHVKASMGFREIIRGGAPMSLPTITLGEGDGTGRSKGFIFKDHDGLNIEFLSNNGQTHWIRMQHDGIEIKGLKRAAYAAAAGEIQWFGINDAAFNLLAEPDPDEIQSVQTTQGGT